MMQVQLAVTKLCWTFFLDFDVDDRTFSAMHKYTNSIVNRVRFPFVISSRGGILLLLICLWFFARRHACKSLPDGLNDNWNASTRSVCQQECSTSIRAKKKGKIILCDHFNFHWLIYFRLTKRFFSHFKNHPNNFHHSPKQVSPCWMLQPRKQSFLAILTRTHLFYINHIHFQLK